MIDTKNNIDIVVYALAKLGGATKRISTEEVALEAFSLAPDRFSWVDPRFSTFPDKEVTRSALEDAAKDKNGNLTQGDTARELSKDGWTLTPSGLLWLEKNRKRIEISIGGKKAELPSLSPKDIQRLRSRTAKEPAFINYKRDKSLDSVSRFMFTDLLQCTPDASPSLIKMKFDRLRNIAELAQEKSLLKFLEDCQAKFSSLMTE